MNMIYAFKILSFLTLLLELPWCQANHWITTGYGVSVSYKDASLSIGPHGPLLLEDSEFIDEMAHFDRERIPERVVHAKGGGAFGYFEVTKNITKYCAAALFSEVGKRTPIAVRFSTVAGESGSADTKRDPRGFAIKFYTEEGNWDLVGNNLPVFFIRDPILFPSFIHTQKRHPSTHLHDLDIQWDFFTLRQEVTHMLMFLFSDRGTPDGFRFMHGFGVNTFRLVNSAGTHFYCKFHYLSNQGLRNLTAKRAMELQSSDPDYAIRDLYNAIKKGNFPTWTFYMQVMTEEQRQKASFNLFDDTKIWPENDYPLLEVGKLVLNENPTNYFAEIEQLAFSPSRMVPGIRPSPDKMLQGRLFSYPDAQRYRLGPNFLQIPVNCPFHVRNFQRDGPMTYENQGNNTNYHPNSIKMLKLHNRALDLATPYHVNGEVHKYDTGEEDNFSQPKDLYENTFDETQREHLAQNLAEAIVTTSPAMQKRALMMFGNVSPDLHKRLEKNLGIKLNRF